MFTADDITCGIEGELFNEENSRCQCGVSAPGWGSLTCAGKSNKPYCDAANNVCKCSNTVDPCTNDHETCKDGVCRCGFANTCAHNAISQYCNAENNVCTRKS